MENLILDNLRGDVRKTIEPYLRGILDIHGENIVSIMLYGSAAGGFYVPRQSDINLMVIFNELGFKELKSSLRLINQGIAKKITAPLFLSLKHIETSKDVFPIEFLEIKDNNILLYGKDIFGDLQIDQVNIRLFCEREIKGKLIRMREAYLEVGLKRKGIEALMKESLSSLMPIFRALIRIKNQKPDVDREKILSALSEQYGLDKNVFIAILRDKTNDEKIAGQDIEIFFEKYLDEIKKLALIADRL